ncbi:MAG: hypothetical protein EOO90_23230 [Pedobacter sp.]|nr:MAG: hypothetical protein EOO90_23230 [Pedobacter sp.]
MSKNSGMKITDIHPEYSTNPTNRISSYDTHGQPSSYITVHISIDGRQIHTEIRRSDITYKRKAQKIMNLLLETKWCG